MDKWIRDLIDKYNGIVFENLYITPYLPIKRLPKGFRRFVTNHLFYYEMMTSKSFEDSHFDFILVYRSTPFKFNVDFYNGTVNIYVFLFDQYQIYSKLMIGKFLISDFLSGFVSGQELEEIQYQDFDDQFEIPF